MKTSECIFCGSRPVTREDVVPRWLLSLLSRNFDTTRSRKGSKGRERTSFWTSDGPGRSTVRCVCRACNNEWMSGIEGEAKSVIGEMVLGNHVVLDSEMQAAVAAWGCLKTMIGAYAWGTNPIPRDWLDSFFQEHCPPPGWCVMTTHYEGTLLQLFDAHRFTLGVGPADKPDTKGTDERGILTTIIVGHLAISVRAVRDPSRLVVRSNIVTLWPSSPLSLIWPPSTRVRDGESLVNFRTMGTTKPPRYLFDLD